MIKRSISTLIITLIIYSSSLIIGNNQTVNAQTGDVVWDPPINLSNSIGGSTRPALAADPWGQVHVFWSEKIGGKSTPEGQAPEEGNSIYYSRWNGSHWSEPTDIFYSYQGEPFKDPVVAIDSKGYLHLVWIGGNSKIYHSQSYALAPVSAKSWQPSQALANGSGVTRAEIATGPSDQIYVVYDAPGDDGLIYTLRSLDGGSNWSAPISISDIYSPEAGFDIRPRIEVDFQGRIHVKWQEQTLPPEFKGIGLYYTYSKDEGITWSQQINLNEGLDYPNEFGWDPGFIVATEGENLLDINIAGDAARRYYRYSQDGGQNWSQARQVFGGLISRAGWDAVAVDGAGTAHLIVQLRYPSALYYSNWSSDNWIDPPVPIITSGPLATAHYPQMVISEGNQIHVVMQEHPGGEIWYMRGVSQAQYNSPAPLPDPQTSPTEGPTSSETTTPSSPLNEIDQVSIEQSDLLNSGASQTSALIPSLIGILAAVLVFVAAFFLRRLFSD